MEKQYYELTNPQKNIWMVELVNDGNNINNISGLFYIKNDEFKYDIHNEVLNELIKNNEALRLNIIKKNEEAFQYIKEFKKQNLEVIDMTSVTKREFNNYIKNEMLKPINILGEKLYEFKIIKLPNMKTCIFYKFHHIISDAWGLIQVATQYSKIYENLYNNIEKDIEIPSYTEYIESEKQYMKSDKCKKDEEFWNEYLKDINEPVTLKNVTKKITNSSKRYSVKLDKLLNEKINIYCKENKVSPYTLFMTALSTYIYRIKDVNDFIIGTPVLNRSNFKEKQMLGMFVSTIPMRFKIEENIKFLDLLKNVSCDTMSIFRHQKYPYNEIIKEVHSKTNIKKNLYNIVLSYQNARANYSDNKKYNAIWEEPNCIQDDLDIHIVDINNEGKLEIYYDYLIDLFDKIEIKYLHTRLIAIIEDAISNENVTVEDIRIMSLEEENKILYEFNDTDMDYPKDKTVIQLFEEQVEKNPDNIALVFEDKKMTYRGLNERANQLAHYLKEEKNVKIGDIIAVYIEKNIEFIIAIFAILKTGAIYEPIDFEAPKDRIEDIFEDSKPVYVLTNINKEYIFNIRNINIVDEIGKFNNENIYNLVDINIKPNDVAYIMYTSGTTGKPKGAMNSNKNLIKLVKNINYVDFNLIENIFLLGSIAFDASIHEIFLNFLNGKTGHIIPKNKVMDIFIFSEEISKVKKSLVILTTQVFHKYSNENPKMFKNVKYLISGGDIMLWKYAKKILKNSNETKLINIYGPTECSAATTTYMLNKKEDIIPIGKPISNSKCYVVDKKDRILPLLSEGELLIGGEGVGLGYLEKSKNKNKFEIKKYLDKEEKIYKSGDLVKWDLKGNLLFIGRNDFQIKIRGYRIELLEIQNKILEFKGIKEAYIIVDKIEDIKKIKTYIVSNKKVSIDELYSYLRKKIPNYMIPDSIIQVENLPLKNNGKVDSKLLLAIEKNNFEKAKKEQMTNSQKKIKKIFTKLLGRKDINIDDNFFENGLDSVEAITFLLEISKKFKVELKYKEIYEYNNIRKLSEFLDKKNKKTEKYNYIQKYNYTNINKILKNTYRKNEFKQKENCLKYLVTGAVGFLGIHIVKELLDKDQKTKVFCLVRAKVESGNERFYKKMKFYFGEEYYNKIKNRVVVLEKDILEKDFENYINEVIEKNKIEIIYNCVAEVKHYGVMEEFQKINVEVTKNLIKIVESNQIRLIHISTLSVSGNTFESEFEKQNIINEFSEKELYIGQKINNNYIYTKYLSEINVLEARARGVDCAIIRVGNLMNSYSTGKFQDNFKDNGFIQRIKFFIDNKFILDDIYENNYLEFSQIDYTAKAVQKLSELVYIDPIYHIYNDNHILVKDFMWILKNKLNIDIKVLDYEDFYNKINLLVKQNKMNDYFILLIDLKNNSELDYKSNIVIKNKYTNKILEKLNFYWPKIDEKYIISFIKNIYNLEK